MNEPTLRDVLTAVESLHHVVASVKSVDDVRASVESLHHVLASVKSVDDVRASVESLRSEFDVLRLDQAQHFTKIEQRLDGHDQRFDGYDKRFEGIQVTLAQHGQAVHELRADVHSLRTVVDGHTASLGRIERRQNAEANALDDHERRITALERRT